MIDQDTKDNIKSTVSILKSIQVKIEEQNEINKQILVTLNKLLELKEMKPNDGRQQLNG